MMMHSTPKKNLKLYLDSRKIIREWENDLENNNFSCLVYHIKYERKSNINYVFSKVWVWDRAAKKCQLSRKDHLKMIYI